MSVRTVPLPESADVVVVGGGLVGLELAKELDRLGVRDVVVLEAGPADDLVHINARHDPDTALRMWLEPSTDEDFWRPWTSTSPAHFTGTAGLRRRLGGRSLYWHGVVLPLEPWALCEPWWPASVVSDLTESWQDGPPLYDQTRSELEAWSDGMAKSETVEIGGYRLSTTPQAVRAAGQDFEAYSPLGYWATEAGSTRVVPLTRAMDVRMDDGQVQAVVTHGGPEASWGEIACRAVILAAGTIENARLGAQALAAATGSEPLRSGLVDHIEQGFVVALDPATLPADLLELAKAQPFLYQACPAELRSNLFAGLRVNEAGTVVLDVFTIGEQAPGAGGQVRCEGTGERWHVAVTAELSAADRQVVDGQRAELRRFWAAFCEHAGQTVQALEFPGFEAGGLTLADAMPGMAGRSPIGQPIAWSQPLGTTEHEAGTLPIGEVLDEQQEFAGINGLFAAGPSTFPRMGAANPVFTCLALAKRLAAEVSARLVTGNGG